MVEAPNKQKGELPYPNSPFRVGDILTVKHHPMYNDGEVFGLEDEQDEPNWITYPQDFPHIFRPMHWSEGRTLDEMPRYLKRIKSGKEVVKAHEYRSIRGNWWVVPEWAKKVGYDSIVTDYLPATEAEYLEYLKSKNNESI